jgi:hypothetical protein
MTRGCVIETSLPMSAPGDPPLPAVDYPAGVRLKRAHAA